MATGELLTVVPPELQFPFELNKQISCTMQLTNNTDQPVAFKVKTTNPKKYCVRPNTGFVLPRSNCGVVVTMQAQKEAPSDLQTKDKFLLQSVIASSIGDPKDITPDLFNKDSGKLVEECKLRVNFVSPQQSPSPPHQVLEERAVPRASVLDDGSLNSDSEFTNASKTHFDHQDNSEKEKALVVRLTQERDSVIQQNNKLQQELELLRSEAKRGQGGIPLMYVAVIGLVAILLGYLIKKA